MKSDLVRLSSFHDPVSEEIRTEKPVSTSPQPDEMKWKSPRSQVTPPASNRKTSSPEVHYEIDIEPRSTTKSQSPRVSRVTAAPAQYETGIESRSNMTSSNNTAHQHNTSVVETEEQRRQKQLLLSKMRAIDEGQYGNQSSTSNTTNFNNSNAAASNNKQHTAGDDFGLTFGDYRPSFLTDFNSGGGGNTSTKTSSAHRKHSHVKPPSNDDLDPFADLTMTSTSTTNARNSRRQRGDEVHDVNNDEDFLTSINHTRFQPSTNSSHTKKTATPAVNSRDNDDIEELTW